MTGHGRFDVFHTYGCPVVEVTGDLDLTNVGEFEATLELAARADRGSVIVCLSRTTYFDSQAIHVLLRFAEHLNITRQRLMIVTPRGTLSRRILEIAGLVQAFPMFDDLRQAVAAAHEGQHVAHEGQPHSAPEAKARRAYHE
jgi:anti-sigma B factor antagonist